MRLTLLVACATCLVVRQALAQISIIDKVFGNVTDINASVLLADHIGQDPLVTDSGAPGLRGIAFEVSFGLGTIWEKDCKDRRESLDAKLRELRVHRDNRGTIDSVRVYDAKVEQEPVGSCRDQSFTAELALGYSQLSGFVGKQLGMRASIEEVPSLAMYFQYDVGGWVSPYLGLRTGFTSLKAARAFSGDTVIEGTGSTYHLGIAPGIVIGDPDGIWGVFIEPSWTWRKFHSIDWSSDAVLPSVLRGPADFSTRTVSIGVQFSMQKP